MSNPFLGQVTIVGFNFAPVGYAFCDGAILPINQNQSLFSLLGTTFGGDGRTSFGLPDLRSRVAIHIGNFNGGTTHALGNKGGEETHKLITGEMPQHTHTVSASMDNNTSVNPSGLAYARANEKTYATFAAAQKIALAPAIRANTGANQGHANQQPYGVLNFCIALRGVFPSRN